MGGVDTPPGGVNTAGAETVLSGVHTLFTHAVYCTSRSTGIAYAEAPRTVGVGSRSL